MKTLPRILLTLVALLSVASGCSDPPTQPEIVPPKPPAPPPAPVAPVNTAPRIDASPDLWVPLPTNSGVLYGSAYDAESNIKGRLL